MQFLFFLDPKDHVLSLIRLSSRGSVECSFRFAAVVFFLSPLQHMIHIIKRNIILKRAKHISIKAETLSNNSDD